jgi:hypothetical protein
LTNTSSLKIAAAYCAGERGEEKECDERERGCVRKKGMYLEGGGGRRRIGKVEEMGEGGGERRKGEKDGEKNGKGRGERGVEGEGVASRRSSRWRFCGS